MALGDDPRVQKSENIVASYIRWMFKGKYIRFFKILYTSLWVTAMVTFQISEFVSLLGGGFLIREVYLIIFRDGYEDESILLNYAD